MGIDQTRDDGPSLEIDDTRARACELSDIRVPADSENPAVAYCQCFVCRKLFVDGENPAVQENRIGCLRCGSKHKGAKAQRRKESPR